MGRPIIVWLVLLCGCAPSPPSAPTPRATAVRAAGRAYDGAPPTIPHDRSAGACLTCHDDDGTSIPGVGVAPASPHGDAVKGAMRRCLQCHVESQVETPLVATRFVGLTQGPWRGSRATPGAPPTIPHTLQLRAQCLACHDGPGARPEIRTTHPERLRCRQCHVPEKAP